MLPFNEPTFFEEFANFLHRMGPAQKALTYFLYAVTVLSGVWALLGIKFLILS